MENVNNIKIETNQDGNLLINNYNINIIDNSSKNYCVDFDSLFQKLLTKKNKKENILNEYYCNLLMIFYKRVNPPTQIELIKLLYIFNNNSNGDNYKYYIFKKLSNLIEKLKKQDIMGINFSQYIDIFLEQGKFLNEKGNKFYAYFYLYNEIYRDNSNIRILRRKIKDEMFNSNQDLKNRFLNFNKKNYKDILSKLKEIFKIDITKESNEFLYIIDIYWLENAINFLKNIINSYEIKDSIEKSFNLYYIYEQYYHEIDNKEASYPYPGKVNNYSLCDFKDIWVDPINEDENYLVNEKLILNKDYCLVNQNIWDFINELFGSTNEIKRKSNNLDLIYFKVVILDKRFIKANLNLFKSKYIQTNIKINIKDFKEKISRCINYALKNENKENGNKKNNNSNNFYEDIVMEEKTDRSYANNKEKFNFNFFKIKKLNNPLLIEIFTAYINGIPNYETLYIEKLDIKDENNLEDLFKNYDPSNDILIIESLLNESNPFIQPLSYDNEGRYECAICKTKITLEKKYECERCNFSIFCSKKCCESSQNNFHINFHEYFSKLQTKLDNKISQNAYNDLVGLINLGNTCFINSSLQCLFNTKDLSNYFLQNLYIKEINTENNQGFNGEIASGLAELLKEMKLNKTHKLNPINFLRTFFKINKTLKIGLQHDAQEFLSILLDYLHEDLNRINKKPYVLLEEQKANESDKEASERLWKSYKMRDDSIIVDLFHGQFKSKITCLKCGKCSINYDPFIFLGLPIPEEKNRMIIKFRFNNKWEFFGFNVKEYSKVLDLKNKAAEFMKMCGYNKNEKNDVLYNNIEFVFVDKYKIIKKIFNNKNKLYNNELISEILDDNKSLELVLYEKKIDDDYFNIYAYPIKGNDYDSSIYPISLSVTGNMSLNDIIQENKQKILNMYVNADDNMNIKVGMLHKKNNSWTYYLTNMFDSKEYCPLCNSKENNFCLINDNIKISHLFNKLKNHLPILFVIGITYKININKSLKIKDNFENGIYFLNDCLNFFCEEEMLNKENMWYCNNCKKHNIAKKQIKLYKMPKYLIIQLKKFENKVNFFNNIDEKKKDVFIKYPINNLDLSDFIDNEEQKKYKYDLYAIVQHHGDISAGHYTAICNINDNWILFNDSQLFKIDTPVTDDAYILFYKRIE